jgi:NADH:ubiquinone oxidoreductase subunit 6 (subunit J)
VRFWQLIADFLTWLAANWLLVLPLVLGFGAIWLLMPQPRRRDVRLAAALGIAGLLVAGLALVDTNGRLADVLFCIFAGIAVVAGVLMITQRNPVYAALWFALVILSTCGLFLLQSAPFLAAATIIVYAGAIIVTFLFVIMLAQQSGLADYDRRSREPLLASLAGLVLLTSLLFVLQKTFADPNLTGPNLATAARQLDQAIELVDNDADKTEVEQALYVDGQTPVGDVLRQELRRQAAGDARQAQLDLLIEKVGDAQRQDQRPELRTALQNLHALATELLAARKTGTLPVPPRTAARVSTLSTPDPKGDYVGALGASLFADYLWAVELAGTLLLVATIGAIAIAHRNSGVSPRAGGELTTRK